MYILIYLIFFLLFNYIVSLMIKPPQKYINYKKIRSLYFNLYEIPLSHKKDFSLEHVVPQSTFDRNSTLKNDMHNILLYPAKINLHRSNYKYVSDSLLYPNSKLFNIIGEQIKYEYPIHNFDISVKNNKHKTFYPIDKYKGAIARSSMYFVSLYPFYKDVIFNKIIDPYTILFWHHEYMIDDFECKKNKLIKNLQGNDNIYISEPKQLVFDMEKILGEKLDTFKDFNHKKN